MIVLDSTRRVMEAARHVFIDDAAIDRWATDCDIARMPAGERALLAKLPGDRNAVANLVLLISALNFCFWSTRPVEIQWRGQTYRGYSAMLASLILAARHEPRWADADFWISVPADELRAVLSGRGELLLLDERIDIVRETGRILLERFDGQFARAVDSVGNRAWPLAVLLMTNLDSFRDVGSIGSVPVYFLKRAQICAHDLHRAWQARDGEGLVGLEELTAFADYRLPQALRHLGLIRLSASLESRIEALDELPPNSPEEIELRAASVQAVDRMAAALRAVGRRVTPSEIDVYLWGVSHQQDVTAAHHRTRTIFY